MKYQPPYGSGTPDAPYINGDPSIARQGSILPAAAAEFPQREIVNFIGNSNQVPDDADLEQMTKGIRNQFVNFCVDSGAVNALSVSLTPKLGAYKQGLPLRVLVANNNTGPAAINVNSLGYRPIKRANGAELEAGDIRAGMIAVLVDDGTVFQCVNYLGASTITNVNNYAIHIPYAEDTSPTPNQLVGNYMPAITSVAPGDAVFIKVKNTNTGAVTLKCNNLAAAPVRRNDGQPLQDSDILADECIFVEYNTSYWQMLRLVKSQVYFKLTADLILYVRTDGNDANNGASNDPAHAFRNIQAAVEYIKKSYLISGRTVTIQLGIPGTYWGQVVITNLPGAVVVRGDPAAKTSYVIQGPNYGAQWVAGSGNYTTSSYPAVVLVSGSGSTLTLTGVTISGLDTQGRTNVIESNFGGYTAIQDVAFGGQSLPLSGCIVTFSGTITIGGYIEFYTSYGACLVSGGGTITIGDWFTLFLMNGANWPNAFAQCNAGMISVSSILCTFAGASYGRRYLVYNGGAILTQGRGPYFLPGNVDGYCDPTSVYN